MEELEKSFLQIKRMYGSLSDKNRENLEIILKFMAGLESSENKEKEIRSLGAFVKRRQNKQKEGTSYNLNNLKSYYIPRVTKVPNILKYSRTIWDGFAKLSKDDSTSEISNFLSYLLRTNVEINDPNIRQTKIVSLFRELFKEKTKEKKEHILNELAIKIFRDPRYKTLLDASKIKDYGNR